jgi:hypothetical protein
VKAFLTVNVDEGGVPREVFITCDCLGTLLDGAMDCWAIALSFYLREPGADWKKIVRKFRGQQFEPRGWTDNQEIRQATSLVDYVARWMEGEFSGRETDVHAEPFDGAQGKIAAGAERVGGMIEESVAAGLLKREAARRQKLLPLAQKVDQARARKLARDGARIGKSGRVQAQISMGALMHLVDAEGIDAIRDEKFMTDQRRFAGLEDAGVVPGKRNRFGKVTARCVNGVWVNV